jgi:hypothetical protein
MVLRIEKSRYSIQICFHRDFFKMEDEEYTTIAPKLLRSLIPADWRNSWKIETFEPCCIHFPLIDSLIYLERAIDYRTIKIDDYLSHLMHPYNPNLVGLQVNGVGYVCTKMRDNIYRLYAKKLNLPANMIQSMVKEDPVTLPMEVLIMGSVGALKRDEDQINKSAYERAINFVREKVVLDPYEIIRNSAKIISP